MEMKMKPELVTRRFGHPLGEGVASPEDGLFASPEDWLFTALSRHGMYPSLRFDVATQKRKGWGAPDPPPRRWIVDLRHYTQKREDWSPSQRVRFPLPLGTIAVLRKARNGRRAWEVHKLNKRITQDELSVMWDALYSELGDTLIAVYQLDVLPFRRVGV